MNDYEDYDEVLVELNEQDTANILHYMERNGLETYDEALASLVRLGYKYWSWSLHS